MKKVKGTQPGAAEVQPGVTIQPEAAEAPGMKEHRSTQPGAAEVQPGVTTQPGAAEAQPGVMIQSGAHEAQPRIAIQSGAHEAQLRITTTVLLGVVVNHPDAGSSHEDSPEVTLMSQAIATTQGQTQNQIVDAIQSVGNLG
jgi:hypothetical protein